MHPDMLHHLKDLFSENRFAVLQAKVAILPDEAVDVTDFFVAEDDQGNSCAYEGPPKQSDADDPRRWLGVSPDNPHGRRD